MLQIKVGSTEYFDDDTGKFTRRNGTLVEMEHSLASMSKWEALTGKSYISDDKTNDEFFLYFKLMVLPGYDPDLMDLITQQDAQKIADYIGSKASATILPEEPDRPGQPKKRITCEQIYSWMISLQIDWDAENWHIGRLLTLIRLVNMNNERANNSSKKPKRVTDPSALANRRAMNQARRAQAGSTG
jgi:hypothetical protein